MITFDYTPAFSPVPVGFRGDTRAGLASEDRDLHAEALDIDAGLDCCAEVTSALYPPICLGTFTIPTIQN